MKKKEFELPEYRIICSIEKINESLKFRNCCDVEIWNYTDDEIEEIRIRKQNIIFPRNMKDEYYKKYNDKDGSRVWVLVGYKKEKDIQYLQVGSTKDLINLLDEVKEAVKQLYFKKGKYSNLKKIYDKIIFYEVDVDEYLKNDSYFNKILNINEDENLIYAYKWIKANYVEGKIAVEKNPSMYHKSVLDGFFYDYIKSIKE